MSDKIVDFRQRPGGRGPEDPGLTARVARLEEANVRIEASLSRLEATSTATLSTTHRIEIEQAEMKGRIKGIEDRFALLPSTMQLIGFAVAVFLAAGVLRFFEPRLMAYAPPAASAPR